MEYEVVFALQRASAQRASDEEAEVAGYIIVIGGSQQPSVDASSPFGQWWFSTPALYSAPQFGAISFGPTPDG